MKIIIAMYTKENTLGNIIAPIVVATVGVIIMTIATICGLM
jgi:hypothetical protein